MSDIRKTPDSVNKPNWQQPVLLSVDIAHGTQNAGGPTIDFGDLPDS